MLKVLGAMLLICGAAAMGFSAAGVLRRRVEGLRGLLAALERMEREISFRLTPVPDLIRLLARDAPPPVNGFFRACLARLPRLGERRFSELWREALAECPMDLAPEDRTLWGEVGDVLGRYDAGGQLASLEEIAARLRRQLERAEADHARLGRVYGALGLTAGSMLAILLI